MLIDTDVFLVSEGQKVDLKEWPTKVAALYDSKKVYKEVLENYKEQMTEAQNMFYAQDQYSLLLIFQAMDAAGKDGAIKHVMSGVNPQGCQVYSFKQPSAEELDHDFLWRTTCRLPERGRIGIFNRSYYEEVLVVKVHPNLLVHQRLPKEVQMRDDFWETRYESIRDFEKHLARNGTRIVKFFLHVSPDVQAKRFLDRIEQPEKNWKMSLGDLEERKFWKDYMKAYESCIEATGRKYAPWYIIPADDKKNARLIISQIILEAFKDMDLHYPEISETQREALHNIKSQLEVVAKKE